MNRKDIIIVAVLLNASILAILFVMASHGNDDQISEPPSAITMSRPDIVELPISSLSRDTTPIVAQNNLPRDELDQMLKDYEIPPQTVLFDDENIEEIEKEPTPIAPQPIAKTSSNQPNEKFVEITVKRGDVLERIARTNGTTVDAIKKANHLNNSQLLIGQVLRIPLSTTITKPVKEAIKPQENRLTANAEPEYYTIKKGDNPWKVAKQFHVKFDDLLKLNNLDEEKARNMQVGDKIRVK